MKASVPTPLLELPAPWNRLEKFRQQDPSVNDALVRRYAIAWVRNQLSGLIRMARSWLFLSMRDAPDLDAVEALRSTLKRWWRSDQHFAALALDDLWTLDRAGSTELLRRIASSPDASTELADRLFELLSR